MKSGDVYHMTRHSLVLIFALGLVLSSCTSDEMAEPGSESGASASQSSQSPTTGIPARRIVPVQTVTLEPTAFEDVIALIGVVDAPRDAILSSQSSGTVISIEPLGTRVSKNDIVARIDSEILTAVLAQAESALDVADAQALLADDTFRRQEPLYRDSIISALEFEQVRMQQTQARAQVGQAQAFVSQAKKQLENTRIRAPFDGTVEFHLTDPGEQVAPGSQIVRIVDTERLRIRAGVPERYAVDIHRGTPVDMDFKAYGVGSREGVISFVGNVIDPDSRSFLIEIQLSNGNASLKPEMIADVFVTRAVLTSQIVLPQTSVLHDELGASVYIVDRSDGSARAVRRTVSLGASYGGKTVIAGGLEEGAEVIVVGQTVVTEGDLVEPVSATPAAA